mgnify:CR=1 FL=1
MHDLLRVGNRVMSRPFRALEFGLFDLPEDGWEPPKYPDLPDFKPFQGRGGREIVKRAGGSGYGFCDHGVDAKE